LVEKITLTHSAHSNSHRYIMIYIARDVSPTAKPTAAFTSRGISNHTQCNLSSIHLFAKPDQQQLAYSGYAKSIEAFIAATRNQTKYTTSAESYPLEKGGWAVPLPMPRLLFQLAKKSSDATVAAILTKFEKLGVTRVEVGKQFPAFLLDRYNFDIVERVLPPLCHERGPILEGITQLIAMKRMMPVYRAVDAFLATHTYEFKGVVDTEEEAKVSKGRIGEHMEIRTNQNWFRTGWDVKKKKLAADGKDVEDRIDDREEHDLTPKHPTQVNADQVVFVAKPSPLPSSTNFGSASDVPNKSGLLFPYFDGMITSDTAAFRTLVSDLFFRNLGEKGSDIREAYKLFREEAGSFASSSSGRVMSHVLTGVRLALEAQAILFLIFDEGEYKGFCLLGEFFTVFLNGKWYKPVSESQLRAELRTIQSRKDAREALMQAIQRCVDKDGDIVEVELAEFTSSIQVARELSRIDVTRNKDEVKEVEQCLGRCGFPTVYRTFKPTLISEAIRLLCDSSVPLPSDLSVYIPPASKDWNGCATREYLILATFGPRSFSFRNAKGTEFKVPQHEKDEDRLAMDDKKEGAQKFMLVSEKKVSECVKDWSELKKIGKVRMDLEERAGGNRGQKFQGKDKKEIWDELRNWGLKGVIGTGTQEVKKRTHDEAFGNGDVQDLLDFDIDF